jgi:hypothetical protein
MSKELNVYQERHKRLIESAGGAVDGLFVMKTGVMITKKSQVTSDAISLMNALNIDDTRPEFEQHAEFNSRLTYLSFKDEKNSSEEFNNMMINKLEHRSVYNDEFVTFLIAGCSVETMTEFIAHNEATVARLTSSKTKAQNYPLFKINTKGLSDEFIKLQKKIVLDTIKLKESFEGGSVRYNAQENEIFNQLTLGNKVSSFTITMSLKDWHKTLIGRLSENGVELEMLDIIEDIAVKLKSEYPVFFKTVDEYYALGNGQKYE